MILNCKLCIKILFFVVVFSPLTTLFSQQQGDHSFNPKIENPVYSRGQGPTVFIDEAHNNLHTREGRFRAFANVLENDGYVVSTNTSKFSKEKLTGINLLVISNAIHEDNLGQWSLPTPSAFDEAEIEALNEWVAQGGSLFLIADHMPFPGAAEDLAKSFGFVFYNGFAMNRNEGNDIFKIKEGGLVQSNLTIGRDVDKNVTSVQSFTGQCFEAPNAATPILVLNEKYQNLMPEVAWQFEENTKTLPAEGFLQGAYLKYDKGRLVVFGEAAMFTAQTNGGNKFGLSAPSASQNIQLLLNILHWLDGTID